MTSDRFDAGCIQVWTLSLSLSLSMYICVNAVRQVRLAHLPLAKHRWLC